MTTALTLTPEERRYYIETMQRRSPSMRMTAAQQTERARLLARVREAVSELRHRFAVRRVVLFGSLAHGAWYDASTDIDLAVEGLKGEDFWDAWRLIEEVIGEREVDFIALEFASEPLRAAIETDGIEL